MPRQIEFGYNLRMAAMNTKLITRRTAIRQTVGFSAAMLAVGSPLSSAFGRSVDSSASHFTMIGDWENREK